MSAMYCTIIDSPSAHTDGLRELAKGSGFDVELFPDVSAFESWLESHQPVLAILSLDMIDDDALFDHPSLEESEVLLMADKDQPARVQKAIQAGAGYFFVKPFSEGFLGGLMEDCITERKRSRKPKATNEPRPLDQFGLLRGSSAPMLSLYRTLRKVAASSASVLIVGESGTGKELVAQTLHQQSDRYDKDFVAVNCGAISASLIESQLFGHEKGAFSGANKMHRGYFECADGGTLFLDEITEMPIELQVKLLRVLETGTLRRLGSEEDIEVDVRIVAATNRAPEEAILDDKLREDLYYRVAQVPLQLPPLRDRGDDKVGLAQYFLNICNEREKKHYVFSDAALKKVSDLPWQGNVRGLQAAVERAFLLSVDIIEVDAVTEDVVSELPDDGDYLRVSVEDTLEESERKLIFAALQAHDGNKKQTAEQLGISLKTLYNRLNEYEKAGVAQPG